MLDRMRLCKVLLSAHFSFLHLRFLQSFLIQIDQFHYTNKTSDFTFGQIAFTVVVSRSVYAGNAQTGL